MMSEIPQTVEDAAGYISFAIYTYFRLHEPDAKQRDWSDKAEAVLPEVLGLLAQHAADDEARQHQREAARAERRAEIAARGGQRVICNGRYTYEWFGEPLAVGDLVLTEGNHLDSAPTWTITSTTSDYLGPCKQVRRVLVKASKDEASTTGEAT